MVGCLGMVIRYSFLRDPDPVACLHSELPLAWSLRFVCAGCDVLWGGCPMVTLPLERMASRVAASLCYATGLGPEMVVNSQVRKPHHDHLQTLCRVVLCSKVDVQQAEQGEKHARECFWASLNIGCVRCAERV